jgi:DNA-binding Xre family transcriptional regulator
MPLKVIRDARANMPTIDIGAGHVVLKFARVIEMAGHSRSQAAAATGLSEGTIRTLCSDRAAAVHLDTVARFCRAYDVKPAVLFEYIPRRRNDKQS